MKRVEVEGRNNPKNDTGHQSPPRPPSLGAYLSSLFLGATRLDSLSQVDKEAQEERGAERDSWSWKQGAVYYQE